MNLISGKYILRGMIAVAIMGWLYLNFFASKADLTKTKWYQCLEARRLALRLPRDLDDQTRFSILLWCEKQERENSN
jgi:hypothetical protein